MKKKFAKAKKVKKSSSTQAQLESHWEKSARYFESDASIKDLALSTAASLAEKRAALGRGKTKPISVRMPEEDLAALKAIAKANDRPYQQLLIQAVEMFIDDFVNKKAS